MKKIILLLCAPVLLFSCHLFQKHKPDPDVWYVPDSTSEAPAVSESNEAWTGEGEILFQNYKLSREKKWLLQHMDLEVSFDFEKRRLYGNIYLTARANVSPQDTLELDAKCMDISAVFLKTPDQEKPAVPLKFIYADSQKLKIIFSPVNPGESRTVNIRYTAKPYESGATGGGAAISEDRGLYFINHDLADPTKPRQIWTQGETESNSRWFPTIDAPNQKITQKISITVPDTMVTLSNGLLKNSYAHSNQTRTDIWEQSLPHAPYLVMIAVGNWAKVQDSWRNKEVSYLVEKTYEKYAGLNFKNTPEMMEFFSNYTGVDFAWDKYSQVVVRDFVSGAMENTSATVHMENLQQTPDQWRDNPMEDYVSHELFHQWFGDLVTAEGWSNITVNESFATYGEYLWRKYKYGQSSADYILDNFRENYNWLGFDETKKLVRYDYEKPLEMFDAVSYQKGALILHMLQYELGEKIFKNGLKNYLEKYRFGTAEADHLRMAMEDASGKDLHVFFDQWYHGKGHPKLLLTIENPDEKNQYLLHIQQTQTQRNAFVFPVKIMWSDSGILHTKKIWITNRNERIVLTTGKAPDWYIFDADNAILCEKSFGLMDQAEIASMMQQLQSAYHQAGTDGLKYAILKDAMALATLGESYEIRFKFSNLLHECLHSDYHYVVKSALNYIIYQMGAEEAASAQITTDTIKKVIRNHRLSSETRTAAISVLYSLGATDEDLMPFTKDSSLQVASKAIFSLRQDGKLLAGSWQKIKNESRGQIAVAWARAMISAPGSNPGQILDTLLTNPRVGLADFQPALRWAFLEGDDHSDQEIAEKLWKQFAETGKLQWKKLLRLSIKSQYEQLLKSGGGDGYKSDDPDAQSDKIKSFQRILAEPQE